MSRLIAVAIVALFPLVSHPALLSQDMSGAAVFSGTGFPASDSVAPSTEQLARPAEPPRW